MASPSSNPNITMLGSATAGLISRSLCHPIDTIKSRMQSGYAEFSGKGFWSVAKQTCKAEGISGLYRGYVSVAVGGTPGVCLYLTSYEFAKNRLLAYFPDERFKNGIYFSCGMIAEIVSCIIFVPVDVVKERLQVLSGSTGDAFVAATHRHNYKGSLHAIRTILTNEGLGGIYRGYGATVLSYGPFSALYFLFYEKLKTSWIQQTKDAAERVSHDQITFTGSLICSAAAGAVSSFITSPLDMAKLRMQILRQTDSHPGAEAVAGVSRPVRGSFDFHTTKAAWEASLAGSAEKGSAAFEHAMKQFQDNAAGGLAKKQQVALTLRQMLKRIYAEDGFRGLFRGAGARIMFHTPSTALTMALFESCTKMWKNILAEQD